MLHKQSSAEYHSDGILLEAHTLARAHIRCDSHARTHARRHAHAIEKHAHTHTFMTRCAPARTSTHVQFHTHTHALVSNHTCMPYIYCAHYTFFMTFVFVSLSPSRLDLHRARGLVAKWVHHGWHRCSIHATIITVMGISHTLSINNKWE